MRFVEPTAVYWWTAGGLVGVAFGLFATKPKSAKADANGANGAAPDNMSTMSWWAGANRVAPGASEVGVARRGDHFIPGERVDTPAFQSKPLPNGMRSAM